MSGGHELGCCAEVAGGADGASEEIRSVSSYTFNPAASGSGECGCAAGRVEPRWKFWYATARFHTI